MTNYYQNNKERLQKKPRKDIKVLLKQERKKSKNLVVKVTKIEQKMKNKKLVERIKIYYKMKKKPYNYKKLILKSNGLKSSFEKAILKP